MDFARLMSTEIRFNSIIKAIDSSCFLITITMGKGSERRKSLRLKSKKEHRKCKSLKGSERRKSNLSDFQILKKCQLPMA